MFPQTFSILKDGPISSEVALPESSVESLKSSPVDASFVLVKSSKDNEIVRNAFMDI